MHRRGSPFRCPEYLLDSVRRILVRGGDLDLISEYFVVGLGGGFDVLPKHLSDPVDVTGSAKTFRVFVGRYRDLRVTAIAMGGGPPYAEWVAALASMKGVKALIGVGWCGALHENISIGDVVLPIAAARDEDTTGHYVDKGFPAVADPALYYTVRRAVREKAESIGVKLWEGVIVSTSSMLSETVEWVEKWRRSRALAVDEETSTLYVLGYLSDVPTAVVLAVSDNVVLGEPRKYTYDVEERVSRTYSAIVEAALEALYEFSKQQE